MSCKHEEFLADVDVNRLQEGEGGPVKHFCADIRIKCVQCGVPLRFLGLPLGLDLNGAAVSVDGTEARLACAPKGETVPPVKGVEGFSITKQSG